MDDGLDLLSQRECEELLQTEHLGRVGLSFGALPAIFPVNYTVSGGDILFRTAEGQKWRAALEGNVVGFEVDYIDPRSREGWSVLVVGYASVVAAGEADALWPVRTSLRAERDGTYLVRIHPELVSGRRIGAMM